MPARICVVGSLNMDLVVRTPRLPAHGETLLARSFASHPGGKGANQALAAARLGAAVALVGRVGVDPTGEALRAVLATEAVDVSEVRALEGQRSGVALISVEDSGENTILVATGANGALDASDLAEGAAGAAQIERASTLLVQLEVPLEAVEAAVSCAHVAGRRAVLNAAPAMPLSDLLLARLDVLVVNRAEAAMLADDDVSADPRALARRIRERTPATVVVTLGSEGALALGEGLDVDDPGFAVSACDTVGAGDAFCAALAVALDEGLPFASALRFACAAGALAATADGAQAALPHRAAVEALASRGR